jgi:hypothetical protein
MIYSIWRLDCNLKQGSAPVYSEVAFIAMHIRHGSAIRSVC